MSLFFVITLLLNVTFGKTETRSETCQVELLIEGAHNFSSLIKGLNCSKGTLTHLTLAAKNSTINTYMTIRDTDLDFIGNISTKNVTIVVKYVKHVRFYLQSCPKNIYFAFENVTAVFVYRSFYQLLNNGDDSARSCLNWSEISTWKAIDPHWTSDRTKGKRRKSKMLVSGLEQEPQGSPNEKPPTSSSHLTEIFGALAAMTLLVLIGVIVYFKTKTKPPTVQDHNPTKVISFPYRYNFKTEGGIYRVPMLDHKLASISEESLSAQNVVVPIGSDFVI